MLGGICRTWGPSSRRRRCRWPRRPRPCISPRAERTPSPTTRRVHPKNTLAYRHPRKQRSRILVTEFKIENMLMTFIPGVCRGSSLLKIAFSSILYISTKFKFFEKFNGNSHYLVVFLKLFINLLRTDSAATLMRSHIESWRFFTMYRCRMRSRAMSRCQSIVWKSSYCPIPGMSSSAGEINYSKSHLLFWHMHIFKAKWLI